MPHDVTSLDHLTQDELWDAAAAARYDTPGVGMESADVLDPTVDRLHRLAGGGPADASVTVTGNQSGAVTSRPVAASPVTPATYALKGVIASRYHAAGGRPVLGNPVHNERGGLVQGGTYQSFRGPGTAVHKILWSPATGAHVVQESGAIGNAWKRADYERGWGYPLGPEHRVGTEMRQYFSNGYVAHWSSITRKTWVTR